MDEQIHIIERINALRQERGAVILGHLYQRPEIQDLADFVGDSLDLSRKARETSADVIVFCGVFFMAESAKILNPHKTVLLPNRRAGCPMADMVTPEDVLALRRQHPNAAVVCYVNSSAAVKAVSDICCTSSNAVKIVQSLREKEIIFIPDRNLGHYVSRFVKDKAFIFHPGYCNVHDRITVSDIQVARADHPGAMVLVHPECRPEVVDTADFTGSTAQIIDHTVKSDHDSFIIGTECGVFHRLEQLSPKKRFYSVTGKLTCPNMKMTTLNDLLHALEEMVHPVELEPEIIGKAAASLERMLAV